MSDVTGGTKTTTTVKPTDTPTTTAKPTEQQTTASAQDEEIPSTRANFDVTSKELFIGETFTLGFTFAPENSTDVVTFSSRDNTIATVDSTTGVVTALKAGTTRINGSVKGAKDGTSRGYRPRCVITVVENN